MLGYMSPKRGNTQDNDRGPLATPDSIRALEANCSALHYYANPIMLMK